MTSSSRSRSNAPVLPPLTFSLPSRPSDPFSLSSSQPSNFASSTSSSSPSPHSLSSSLFHRPSSPTRVNLSPLTPSFRISLNNRSLSPNSRVSAPVSKPAAKRTCMCSPTNHPGSFRCAFHRSNRESSGNGGSGGRNYSCSPSSLNLRRSAMTNSLVRIGTVEGDWVRRALTALIRPSSHQQRRRWDFQPRPSRLSVMSVAGGDGEV